MEHTRIKIELDVSALKVTQMLETYNTEIEQEVQQGVQAAIEYLSKEGTLADMVKEQVIQSVIKGIQNQIGGYEPMKVIREKVQNAIQEQVGVFADKLIEEVKQQLKLK